jgi:hypothetical protein
VVSGRDVDKHQLTPKVIMVHPTLGSKMMFGSDHKSHRQPDELFLLLGKLSTNNGLVLVVQLGRG